MQKGHKANQRLQKEGNKKTKRKLITKEWELRNERKESLDVSPQALDQENHKKKQTTDPRNFPCLQKSTNYAPSKYTKLNTMERHPKC